MKKINDAITFELSKNLTNDDKRLWAILLEHAATHLYDCKEHCINIDHVLKVWSQNGLQKNITGL